ncbi:transcription elongation factor GreA [Patescibacteria group bacterium]|nr:transcription elongation factor GreA [Patescibacteria group bacterium]
METSPREDEKEVEYLSKDGLEKLKKELEVLKTHRRKEIAGRLEYARSFGDLSENSEYQEAKQTQLENELRVSELEDVLLRSVVVKKPQTQEAVSLGSTVVIKRTDDSSTMRLMLAGSEELGLSDSKISYVSPLGRALLGRKKGDQIRVSTPKGEAKYRILDII